MDDYPTMTDTPARDDLATARFWLDRAATALDEKSNGGEIKTTAYMSTAAEIGTGYAQLAAIARFNQARRADIDRHLQERAEDLERIREADELSARRERSEIGLLDFLQLRLEVDPKIGPEP
jgi:hypothetical protein